jgi:radical SAM superfamily enzyme YgiQ (UPF0313 family)
VAQLAGRKDTLQFMKILLINSPIRLNAQPNCIPYGLAAIGAVLKDNGFDVEIYDINARRPQNDDIVATLQEKEWDLVGLSGLITTYGFQKWLIHRLKTINPKAPVISGGGLATSSSEILFDHTSVDITVIGEGEQTMLELCQVVETGGDLRQVPGIWHRENGHIVKNKKRKLIENLDALPLPAWDLLPMEIYLTNPIWGGVANNSSGFREDVRTNRSMNIISSRGCPFSCNYCYHLFGPSTYRFRSAGNVVKEIAALVDAYHVDFIGFVDDNMMASERQILEFCHIMDEACLPVTWGCHGRVTSATPRVLGKMAEAGCVWIGYGVESGSQRILDAMNKKTTVARAKQAIIDTRKAGIYPNTTFIFGYPGETLETIQQTVDFKRDLQLDCGSFFATPYPGAALYNQIRNQIGDADSFVNSLGNATEFSINLTGFSDEELFGLKKAMDANEDVM